MIGPGPERDSVGEYCGFSGLPQDREESETLRIYGRIEILYKERGQSIFFGCGQGKWVFDRPINSPLNVHCKLMSEYYSDTISFLIWVLSKISGGTGERSKGRLQVAQEVFGR